MADYKDRLEEWRETARRKVRELDDKFGIKDRVEESAKAAQDAAKRGVDSIVSGAERARSEAEKLSEDYELRERAERVAEDATRVAREAGETVRSVGKVAEERAREKANELFDDAREYYERASRFYDVGLRFTRVSASATGTLFKAVDWIRENPGKAAIVSLSIATGVRLGASFPGLDAVFLGSHPHWFTHSALPVYLLRRAGEKFDNYLNERERLIRTGELDTAERQRVEFERQIIKYVGAPLLGTFSCAIGATLWIQMFQPGRITGAPISWLLGGNPFLDGMWLFANGVICFHQGYKFFMIALKDQKDVERVVREFKGLLTAGTEA
jgi:ElaB/YqjD/DUF883 family membrane-anchored ribosome-binding protein